MKKREAKSMRTGLVKQLLAANMDQRYFLQDN